MSQQYVIGRAELAGETMCSISCDQGMEFVELAVGNTSLKLEARNFMLLNEMMRKAAAKIVMNPKLNSLRN